MVLRSVLHAAALRQGSLWIVQPVVVSAVVFAVFVRAGLDRRLPARKEIAWAICTWAGLALFIAVLPSGTAQHAADGNATRIFFAGGIVITDMAVLCAQKTTIPARRGMLLGGAAGVFFGLIAGPGQSTHRSDRNRHAGGAWGSGRCGESSSSALVLC